MNEILSKGELSLATITAANFTPENVIEQNIMDVFSIALSSRTGKSLNTAEIKKLQTIAKLCPYESGPAVYNARALLTVVENTIYTNPCEIPLPADSKSRIMEEERAEQSHWQEEISIYPNPASNKLNITIQSEKGQPVLLSLYDLTGKLALSSTFLSDGNNSFEIPIGTLREGIYLYKLNVNGLDVKSGKLSIIH